MEQDKKESPKSTALLLADEFKPKELDSREIAK